MIRAEHDGKGIRLVAVPSGSVAYVDRDWIPPVSGSVPSITVAPDGALSWCDTPVQVQAIERQDMAAAHLLLAVARKAANAVERLTHDDVEVIGQGLIARQIRVLLGDERGGARIGPPRAVIDATGDPAVILDATQRIADLGTIVLAGEALGRRAEMNLYPDVHVRGLTFVGITPPQDFEPTLAGTIADEPFVRWCLQSLVPTTPGSVIPPSGVWYRVSGETR